MSNNLKLEVLLKAVDQVTRPFKAIETASKSLSDDIRTTQQSLRELSRTASKIDGFRTTITERVVVGQDLANAQQKTRTLSTKFKSTGWPTAAQVNQLDSARRAADGLQTKYDRLTQSIKRQQTELGKAGINTRNLTNDESRLKNNISEKTIQLNRQRAALTCVSAQQAKLSAVKSRYASGQRLADRVRNSGVAATNFAKSGLSAELSFIAPGIDFDKQMSGTQAIFGLDKEDTKLAAICQQARDIGVKTGISPTDVARTQTTLARSGYKADDVLDAAGSTISLSLASGVDVAEVADIMTNLQSAFNLPATEAQRISDVMAKGFSSSGTGLIEFEQAMQSVAPGAAAAGAGIEDTVAMLAVLAENGVKGSKAGVEASAIFDRLQSAKGKSANAIAELGVTTRDSKGNMLPVESILKAINTSFSKNKLGSAEQDEYLKAIFGQEGMEGATKLVAAAGNGTLENKRQEIQNSSGTSELIANIQTDNLDGDLKKLQSAWESLQIGVVEKQDTALRQLTQSATEWLGTVATWIKANPELTKTLFNVVTGALAIIGVLGGVGQVAWPVVTGINTIILAAGVLGTYLAAVGSTIVTVFGAITWPVVAVAAAVVAGALLIRKYWEPISAFFGGVIEGLISAFAPIGEMFAPLAPVFDWLGEKISSVWQWFKDLIAPVKATQDTLNSCRDVGVVFGQALADALMLPLTAFNKLRSGIDWVLEKLGIINKESSTLDQTAENASAATQSGYTPNASYYSYLPATSPAGRSYIDQSKSEYHFTLQGGIAPGGQLDNQLRDAVERMERDRRAKARASMMHD